MKYRIAGMAAARQMERYGTPRISAMMKAPALMIEGMICPPVEATASTAPANLASYPVSFMRSMVKLPVVTTLPAELPPIGPKSADAMIATLAGPPRARPAIANARSMNVDR